MRLQFEQRPKRPALQPTRETWSQMGSRGGWFSTVNCVSLSSVSTYL